MSQAAWFSEWIPQFPWFSHQLGKYIERKVLEWKMLHDVFLFPIDHPGITVPLKLMGLLTSEPAAWRSSPGKVSWKNFSLNSCFLGSNVKLDPVPVCVPKKKSEGRKGLSQLKHWLPTVAAMIYTFIDNPPQLSSTVHSDIPVPNMKPQAPGGLDQRLHLGIQLWANICLDNKVRNPILRPEVMRKLIMICAALYAAGTAFLLTGHTAISEHDLWYRIFNWQDS